MEQSHQSHFEEAFHLNSHRMRIVAKSLCVGLLVGVMVTLYRLVLVQAEEFATSMYAFFRGRQALIPLLFVLLAGAGYGVGRLTNRFRYIGGSGIPQVKGILMGHFKIDWLGTFAAKFVGGAIAILAGLSLGREGPSIQLGACIAQGLGGRLASSRTEKRLLIASGASAGLAAAFNAPLAGVMFAMEELFRYISPLILLSTTVAAVVADFVSKMVFGTSPVFHFATPVGLPLSEYWLLCLLGALSGVAGAVYNATLLKTQALYQKLIWWKGNIRLVAAFLFAGVMGLLFPIVLGGGHAMVDKLHLSTGISLLFFMLMIKFFFSMISFGSGAPGGIFFPLLIMGAAIGAVFGSAAINGLGLDPTLFDNFMVVAMAGFFSAIVRAPITGVILLLEMTGSFTNLLPLVIVSITAYVVADLLGSKPIYDSLLDNLTAKEHGANPAETDKKITVESIVHFGSPAAGAQVSELDFPEDCLLVSIRREGKELIPKGSTKILADDYLLFLMNVSTEACNRKLIDRLTFVE